MFRRYKIREEANAAEPARTTAVAPHPAQNDFTVDQRRILTMQNRQGNHAVLRMFSSTVLQRDAEIGWNVTDQAVKRDKKTSKLTTGPNSTTTTVNVDDKNPALGSARRIPVRGLKRGSSLEDSQSTDWHGDQISTLTDETAKEQQAIVVVPDNLKFDKPIGVLLHLQGLTIGYRSHKGAVHDVEIDRIEQQLRASGQNMIAILPQAGLPNAKKRAPDFGGVDRGDYFDEVFEFLSKEHLWTGNPKTEPAERPARGAMVLSSHSGGSFMATGRLDSDVAGKDTKKGELNPAHMAGVVLFDSIHFEAQANQVIRWATAQINHDVFSLSDLAKTNTDPAQLEQAQLDYLTKSMQFRGIYSHTENDYYAKNYKHVADALKALFDALDAKKALPSSVTTRLRSNYQIIDAGHKDHDIILGQGNQLQNALQALPPVSSLSAVPQPTAKGKPEPAKAQRTVSPAVHEVQRQPAPQTDTPANTNTTGQTAPPDQLIDTTVQLAQNGSSRLQPDYIRRTLQSRASNPALSAQFDAMILSIRLQRGIIPVLDVALVPAAQNLLQFMEKQFVSDPNASTLDLLARGQSYRNRRWDVNDYPGAAENEPNGPHEDEGRRMMNDLIGIEPERRPNSTSTAVVDEAGFNADAQLRRYVKDQLRSVPAMTAEPGQPAPPQQSNQRLNATALDAFVRMRQAAKADGVDLIILDGYRTPETSKALGAGQNGEAQAQGLSSHNLGLAMDLQMSNATQTYREIKTHPMQNVVDMHAASAHKWMFLHGPDYGWYPWHHEPWHWEYNPEGFRTQFQTEFQAWSAANPPPATRRRR